MTDGLVSFAVKAAEDNELIESTRVGRRSARSNYAELGNSQQMLTLTCQTNDR